MAVRRGSVDGRAVEMGEGGDVTGPRVVAGAGSMFVGPSVLGRDVGDDWSGP